MPVSHKTEGTGHMVFSTWIFVTKVTELAKVTEVWHDLYRSLTSILTAMQRILQVRSCNELDTVSSSTDLKIDVLFCEYIWLVQQKREVRNTMYWCLPKHVRTRYSLYFSNYDIPPWYLHLDLQFWKHSEAVAMETTRVIDGDAGPLLKVRKT